MTGKKNLTNWLGALLLSVLSLQTVAISAACCPPQMITITSVPTTLYASNTTYCVQNQLTFAGAAGAPAITIAAGVNDIVLDFNGFDLTLMNGQEIGVQMLGTTANKVSNVTIKNGTIQSAIPATNTNCNAIALVSTTAAPDTAYFSRVQVNNMRFIDTRRGILSAPRIASCFDLTVSNCQFSLGGVTSSRGISLGTIQGLVVEDCSFLPNPPNSAGSGILLQNGANATVERCSFNGLTNRAIDFEAQDISSGFQSNNFLVKDCEISFCSVPFIGLSIKNINFTNCAFYQNEFEFVFQVPSNATGSPIPSGLIIDGCTFSSESELTPADLGTRFLRLGGPSAFNSQPRGATNIIVRNSTFSHLAAPVLNDDIFAFAVDGLLIENCVFDSNSTGRNDDCTPVPFVTSPDKSANIHLGSILIDSNFNVIGGSPCKNVTIRGNQFGTASQVSIYADTSIGTTPNQNIVIEDNNITATEFGILLENTINSLIQGNHVVGVNGSCCLPTGTAIQLSGPLSYNAEAASTCNAILNNTVSGNSVGIMVECGAEGNLVKGNNVFNNRDHQIVIKDKKTNAHEHNTTFHTTDCGSTSVFCPPTAKLSAVKKLADDQTHIGLFNTAEV